MIMSQSKYERQETPTCDQNNTGKRPHLLMIMTANKPPQPKRKILQLDIIPGQ
jgi:hypothetical protein